MDEQLALAIEHRRAERYTEAEAILTELRAAYPTSGVVYYQSAWLMDTQGKERAAVPYYEQAIALGLPPDDLRGALLGLGSTYRSLGEYAKAADVLRRGMTEFPHGQEFATFLAMALYNLGEHAEAMELLLRVAAETSTNDGVQKYKRAILFYADKLDEVWE
jgi:tetratricopeptide (TPR) repeat protein